MVRKSGKTKKNNKSQVKIGGFCKKSGNFFIKTSDIVSSNLLNFFYFKASISDKLIKNSLKSD